MQPKLLSASRHQAECELYDNYPLRMTASKGRRVECTAGVLWITVHGHPSDIFLRAGKSFVVPNDGLVLVEGVGRSRMRVTAPASPFVFGSAWIARGMRRLRRGWKPRADAV
jgi:hypothetical protein